VFKLFIFTVVKTEKFCFVQNNAWYARSRFVLMLFQLHDYLILRNIIEIADSRCHISKLKCTEFHFYPRPRWEGEGGEGEGKGGIVAVGDGVLVSINEVNLRRARLVLRWATVSGFNSRCRTLISVCNQPANQGQLSLPSLRVGKLVAALAWKADVLVRGCAVEL